MPRTWIASALALTVAGTAVATAQTQDGRDQPVAPPATPSAAITVTGCLQRSEPASPAGTTAATPNAAPAPTPQQFVLMNAGPSGSIQQHSRQESGTVAGAAAVTGATGTTSGQPAGTSGSSRSPQMNYVIEGSRVELSQHVGHRVEVTGKVLPSSSMKSGSAGTTDPSPSASAAPAEPSSQRTPYVAHPQPHLEISSIRMVSQGCDGQ